MKVVKKCRESRGVRPFLTVGLAEMIDGCARAGAKGRMREDVSVWLGRCVRGRCGDACGPVGRCRCREPNRLRPDCLARARACRPGFRGLARARSVGQIEQLGPALLASDDPYAGLWNVEVLRHDHDDRLIRPAFVRPLVYRNEQGAVRLPAHSLLVRSGLDANSKLQGKRG